MKLDKGKNKPSISRPGIIKYLWRSREAFVWIIGLTMMATMDPVHSHASLCPLSALGISWCPGCGLGHSIAWLFRAELLKSFQTHMLGIPAVLIILYRVFQIIKTTLKEKNYGTSYPVHA